MLDAVTKNLDRLVECGAELARTVEKNLMLDWVPRLVQRRSVYRLNGAPDFSHSAMLRSIRVIREFRRHSVELQGANR